MIGVRIGERTYLMGPHTHPSGIISGLGGLTSRWVTRTVPNPVKAGSVAGVAQGRRVLSGALIDAHSSPALRITWVTLRSARTLARHGPVLRGLESRSRRVSSLSPFSDDTTMSWLHSNIARNALRGCRSFYASSYRLSGRSNVVIKTLAPHQSYTSSKLAWATAFVAAAGFTYSTTIYLDAGLPVSEETRGL